MSRISENRIRHIRQVVELYDHSLPFHHFLREHFRHNRQYGSSDRRLLRQYGYAWMRSGCLFSGLFEKKLAAAIFLCSAEPDPVFDVLNEQAKFQVTTQSWHLPAADKMQLLGADPHELFPLLSALSSLCDSNAYAESLLKQPLLWVRVRRGHENTFASLLKAAKVSFERHEQINNAFGLPNGFDLEELMRAKSKTHIAEVQDLSSQKACYTFKPETGARVWDCCAASGGKSLLLMDAYPQTQLFVSDLRESILHNLKDRFRRNEIRQYHIGHADLFAAPQSIAFEGKGCADETVAPGFFDVLLVDAPCSGSGTWARTPEHICTASSAMIADFAERQQLIVQNALPFLKKGGQLVYMTCSVFATENEKQTAHFVKQHGLQLQHQELIQGYAQGADTLFAAVLRK